MDKPAPDKSAEKVPEKGEEKGKTGKTREAAKPTKGTAGSGRSSGSHSQAKVYQPAQSYAVGEVIYHPVWKAEGKVIEVGKTPDGVLRIEVDFPDLGRKRLVAEYNQIKL